MWCLSVKSKGKSQDLGDIYTRSWKIHYIFLEEIHGQVVKASTFHLYLYIFYKDKVFTICIILYLWKELLFLIIFRLIYKEIRLFDHFKLTKIQAKIFVIHIFLDLQKCTYFIFSIRCLVLPAFLHWFEL